MKLTREFLEVLQNRLKVGNRRGVHLNSIPGRSRYKFDIDRLRSIKESMPEDFLNSLLINNPMKFKISWKENVPDLNSLFEEDQTKLVKITKSIDNLINQTEAVESEKGINTFGFGFPQLIRRDEKDNKLTVSPLLIWSLRIKRTKEFNTWEVVRNEDDPIYINEVLINHLQSDSQILIPPISEEMLDDGLIDHDELIEICCTILNAINSNNPDDLSAILANKLEAIEGIKTKKYYESLPLSSNNSFIEFGGLFSMFEVQKQNIIKDYTHFLEMAGQEIEKDDLVDHYFQPLSGIQTDPTQQKILNSLDTKRNIVIQGPPGTGKSQTLSAVLINALENKKKTIVVCEKRTALDVLYNALENKGLSHLVAHVIDSVKDRRKNVDSVRGRLETFRARFDHRDAHTSLKRKIEKLKDIITEVNKRHSAVGKTIYDRYNWTDSVGLYLKNERDSIDGEKIELSGFNYEYTAQELNEKLDLLKKGQRLYQEYRDTQVDQFLNSKKLKGDNPLLLERTIKNDFKIYGDGLKEVSILAEDYKESYVKARIAELRKQVSQVEGCHQIIFDKLQKYNDKPEFTDLRITNSFGYKLKALFSSKSKQLVEDQKGLYGDYDALLKKYADSPDLMNPKPRLGLHKLINHSAELHEKLTDVDNGFREKALNEYARFELLHGVPQVYQTDEYKKLKSRVDQVIQKIRTDSWSVESIDDSSYQNLNSSVNAIVDKQREYFNQDSDPFKSEFEWFGFYNIQTTEDQQLVQLLSQKADWRNSMLISYLDHLLISNATNELPTDGVVYGELEEALSDIGDEQIKFIKQYWASEQKAKSREFADRTNLSVENLFQKRNSKKRKKLSLRQIAKYDIDLFTTFFPVILTTPDECSKLFAQNDKYFDIVMFDEASQLRIEDNLPALLKGKQIIVAGDEHQMPPSDYFNKMFDGMLDSEDDVEEDEVVIDIENALLSCESLLDFAEELNFEKRYLDFHYRSKHPYLIDFSNQAFYNGRLKPLPITVDYNPIKYIHVDGTYSDTSNLAEAEAVLSILEHNIAKLPNGDYPSVGVATLNITQRNLIISLIRERQKLKQHDAFSDKIIELQKRGLFIKNLENIQGDERDVIILSTTYGINADGKFAQRFGPMNHAKGYKLLNVIITRAKYKLYVCTSIPEEAFLSYKDLLLAGGGNNRRGVFYAYLAYAKAVSERNDLLRLDILQTLKDNNPSGSETVSTVDKDLESPFEEEVYVALVNRYNEEQIRPQLEHGGFRIDIVYESVNPNVPKIAIECDGASYHSSREAYLYDLHRQRILESCGFVFYRIWSTNWFRNTKREEEKLVAFIEKVEAEYIHGSKAESFDQSFTDDVILKPNKIRPSRNLFSEVKEVSDEPIKQGQSKKPLKEEKRATPENQESENIAEQVVDDQPTPVVQNVASGIRQEELTIAPRQEVQVIEKDCVNKLSKVKVLYLNNGKEIIVELADFLSNKPVANDGILRIKNDTPLAKSIIGKAIGDTVQVGKGDYYVQILKLLK